MNEIHIEDMKKEIIELQKERQANYMWSTFTLGVSVGFALTCALWYYFLV